MTTDHKELKACPFCKTHAVQCDRGWYFHHRAGCFLSLHHGSTLVDHGEEAAWNTRNEIDALKVVKPQEVTNAVSVLVGMISRADHMLYKKEIEAAEKAILIAAESAGGGEK